MAQFINYPVVFARVKGANFIARVPDFVKRGYAVPVHEKTIEDAKKEVREIVEGYLEDIAAKGEDFPTPSTILEAIDGFKSDMDDAGHDIAYIQVEYVTLGNRGE